MKVYARCFIIHDVFATVMLLEYLSPVFYYPQKVWLVHHAPTGSILSKVHQFMIQTKRKVK